MKISLLLRVSLVALLACGLGAGTASAAFLSVGSGDGSLSVEVDPFGRAVSTGLYDPIGSIGPAPTIFDSYIATNNAGAFRG